MQRHFVLLISIISIAVISCKKSNFIPQNAQTGNLPLYLKNETFPNGILKFRSQIEFDQFYNKVQNDINYSGKVISGFKSSRNIYDDYYKGVKLKTQVSLFAPTQIRPTLQEPQVSKEEFLMDLYGGIIIDETMEGIVNSDLEFIVGDKIYKYTRVGVFSTTLSNVSELRQIYIEHENDILYNPNFEEIPGQTSISENMALVGNAVNILDGLTLNLFNFKSTHYLIDNGGCSQNCDSDDYLLNTYVPKSFNREFGFKFNNDSNKRFIFFANTDNFSAGNNGFHKINITAKMQRRKKFLFSYWAESYADEIIIGCNNMYLETDYVFPYPQEFSTLSRPTFDGLADFAIGNWVLKAVRMKANFKLFGFILSRNEIAKMLDGSFNSLVGNVYNNGFKFIEEKLIKAMDPSYVTSKENTTLISALNDDHILRFITGYTAKPQGYSSSNNWTFDWNVGIGFSTGSAPPPPLTNPKTTVSHYQSNYNYTMKAGTFFAKVRIGNTWRGIRMVVE